MIKLLRLELRKILTYKTFWVIIGLYFLFLASGIILAELIINNWVIEMNRQLPIPLPRIRIYFFPDIWQNLAFFASIRYILIFPAIIVIILITNEFTFKTIRQNVVTGMSKKEFLLSKLSFILLLSLFITVILKLVIFTLGITHSEVTSFSQIVTKASFIYGFFVILFSFLIISFFFGFIFRNTGLAIALFTLYVLIIEPILSGVSKIPSLHLGKLSHYLPVNAALNVIEYPYIPVLKTLMGLHIQESVSLMDCAIPLVYSAILIGIVFFVMIKKDL
jgi:ABC-2 type transport system permease protein